MAPTPEITQTLRTAADWPKWFDQVNSHVLGPDLRKYIFKNAAGELDLSPPKPPPEVPDQIRRTKAHNSRQLDRETKYLEYLKFQNHYLSFMLAVQRSIDPRIGLDLSEDRSFGTLIQALKNHLGLNGSAAVTPSAKARDRWSVVIRQDLKAASAEDWGETLVKAYRSARKHDLDGFASWGPHVEFVEHVKRSYPDIAGTLGVYIDGVQEDEGDIPRKEIFGQLVRFGIRLVVRQGGAASANLGGSASEEHFGRKALEYPEEPQRPDTSNTPKRKRKEHDQNDKPSELAKKKAKTAPAEEEVEKVLAKNKVPKAPAEKKAKKTPAEAKPKRALAKEIVGEAPATDTAMKSREEEFSLLALADPPETPSLFVTGTTPKPSPSERQDNNSGNHTTSGVSRFGGEMYDSLSRPKVPHLASHAEFSKPGATPTVLQSASLHPQRRGAISQAIFLESQEKH